MSNLKARLTVVLKADEVVVAESEDASLWQRVLQSINSGSDRMLDDPAKLTPAVDTTGGPEQTIQASNGAGNGADSKISRLAARIGLASSLVVGACDPKETEPFLQLDMHAWSAVKSQLPERGAKALSPMAVAGTLLALWCKEAGLATATQAQVQKVLATISLHDKNPSRGIRSAPWLQSRPGGQIVLNPAAIQKAILLAKSFCAQDWKAWNAAED